MIRYDKMALYFLSLIVSMFGILFWICFLGFTDRDVYMMVLLLLLTMFVKDWILDIYQKDKKVRRVEET